MIRINHYLALVAALVFMSGLFTVQAQESADQNGCESAFDDARTFIAEVFEKSTAEIENGEIGWDSTDWDNIVRRVVGTSEFYLNNCTDPDQPLADQPEAVAQLAEMSLIESPIETLDIGGDFNEVPLGSDFEPRTAWIDLNGDEVDELLLHTQIPYFSQKTVYSIRGGLSIAFFDTEDGWQGQVIAPITSYVTSEQAERLTYAMTENHTLSVQEVHEALVYLPAPEVQVLDVEDTQLTFITLYAPSPTGETKELAVLTWDDRFPSVELRVAFDDWCYPGRTLDWEIRDDGSVYIPSNGGEEGSPLHCGRTPEVLFQWADGEYIPTNVE